MQKTVVNHKKKFKKIMSRVCYISLDPFRRIHHSITEALLGRHLNKKNKIKKKLYLKKIQITY